MVKKKKEGKKETFKARAPPREVWKAAEYDALKTAKDLWTNGN